MNTNVPPQDVDSNLIKLNELPGDISSTIELNSDELDRLNNPYRLSDFTRNKIEHDSKRNWNYFYKRNGDRFFKSRYWTRQEFSDLFVQPNKLNDNADDKKMRYLLEIGCGCGDFVLPLIGEKAPQNNKEEEQQDRLRLPSDMFVYCCDISDTAINLLKSDPRYGTQDPLRIKAFVADVTQSLTDNNLKSELDNNYMDFITMIFVLSALDPRNFARVISNLRELLKIGGVILLRDYAVYDKAMLKFKSESRVTNQLYVRQDGTRAYFFHKQELIDLFEAATFQCLSIEYIKRETINRATNSKFTRLFIQAKFVKLQ